MIVMFSEFLGVFDSYHRLNSGYCMAYKRKDNVKIPVTFDLCFSTRTEVLKIEGGTRWKGF